MKKVDFYLLGHVDQQQRFQFCCQWLAKYDRHTKKVDAIIATEDDLPTIDNLLWTHDPSSFIAHQISSNYQANNILQLIHYAQIDQTPHQTLINLDDHPTMPENALKAKHIIEIITQVPTVLSPSRQRYRQYKNNNFAMEIHDLATTAA